MSQPNSENYIFEEKSKKKLIEFIGISKGKIMTLLKTVFSFLNDNSLLNKDSSTSFEKYIIDIKFIQTMTKIYYFYSSNYENGKIIFHELLKERYTKFIKYYEQNINYFLNEKELLFRYFQIQGLILLWLIETNYTSEYYDELIRLINSLIRLDEDNNNINNINRYLNKFLKLIIKFPFIKQNRQIIIQVLEVNECDDNIISFFNINLNNSIQIKNSNLKQSLLDKDFSKIIGKKNINTKNDNSYFSLIKANSPFSFKRNSYNNGNFHKELISSINSNGFYTQEFKNYRWDSIRHFRRFTINNINNPKTSILLKNDIFSKNNNISEGMNNLLVKCEEGKNKNISEINNKLNVNGHISTKSKLRLAIQGHFYTEDDFKNNIEIKKEDYSKSSLSKLYNENIKINEINNINNNYIYNNSCENKIEINMVSGVDELPKNTNISIMSNNNSKYIGIELENIIQETKEEEEIDENQKIKEKKDNKNIKNSSNYYKILSVGEDKNFSNQQFNNKNNNNDKYKKNSIYNNKNKNKKRNTFSRNNSSKKNSISPNSLINKNKKNVFISNKDRQNNKKSLEVSNSDIIENKGKRKSKEKNIISIQDKLRKMNNYNNQNVFGIIKNHKNYKKGNHNILKNKNENFILEPSTKGKELMNNIITQKHYENIHIVNEEKMPTDSVAKKNLFSLYNQMKTEK